MPKLIILTDEFKGKAYELKPGVNTVGRAEDNQFCIPEGSISGHHCEIILNDKAVTVKDLESTNGSYINDNQITEAPLKAGMILRLGQCQLKLDDGTSFKQVMQSHRGGVKIGDVGTGTTANPAFKKKDNKMNIYLLAGGIVVVLGIVIFLILK